MKLFIFLLCLLNFLSAETNSSMKKSCEDSQELVPKKYVENEFKTILYKVKIYKKEKDTEIIALRKKLNSKEEKIKELHRQLTLVKEQLREKKKMIVSLNEKLNENIVSSTEEIVDEEEVVDIEDKSSHDWIKVTVENNLNIYDLALKYYGDSQEYEKIYIANKNIIGQDYQIENGMILKIPITENFIE